MENLEQFLELAKQLAETQYNMGRMEAELEMKDNIISGLTAQLAFAKSCSCGNETKLKNHVKAVDIPTVQLLPKKEVPASSEELEKIYPMEVNSISEEMSKNSELTETPAVTETKKKGRPKGSKNSTVKKSVESESKLPGGSVFKDFVPLDLDNLLGKNTSAYISENDKKDSPTFVLGSV